MPDRKCPQSTDPNPAICFVLLSNKCQWGKYVYNSLYGGGNPVACHIGVRTPCWFQENVKLVQLPKVSHDELHSYWLSKNSRPSKFHECDIPRYLAAKPIKAGRINNLLWNWKSSMRFRSSFVLLFTLSWDRWVVGWNFGSCVSAMTY